MSKINYDLSKIRGVVFDVDGVLSPSTIPMHTSGEPMRMVNIKDGYAIQHAVKMGLKIAILSGARTEAIRVRFEGLGINDVFLGASMKLPILKQWMADNELSPAEVAYCGDDIPDLPCMTYVGLPVAPLDAATEIRERSAYISPVNGGYGVGRDLLEQIMKVQGTWLGDEVAFGW